jgi:predicted CXXCH cytochrome family protein
LQPQRFDLHRLIVAGLTGLLAAGLAVLLALLLNSCASAPRTVYVPPQIPGAHYTGNRACLDCHTNYVRTFMASPHARIHLSDTPGRSDSGCESCHGAGSLHVAAGGGRGRFIHNPGRDATACFNCHLNTHAEFQLAYHHPVIEKHMTCVQCHDPHGADILKPAGGLAMARMNEGCAQCHREQTRPVTFEHEAMREGCATCHNPHGSINRKLLTQADANLCLRCHAQNQGALAGSGLVLIGTVDHTAFLSRGTCWASGCHTAVHGSNVDPRLRY